MAIRRGILGSAGTLGRVAAVALAGSVAVVAGVGLSVARAWKATRPEAYPDDQRASGVFGDYGGPPVQLAVLGDSLAVGVGADAPEHTVGAILATSLSRVALRPVEVHNVAVVGARSADLDAQLADLLGSGVTPDVAVIVVGSNDVMHHEDTAEAVRHLYRAVTGLRRVGSWVVVATCPDLGTLRLVSVPLRPYLRRASRRMAAAQTNAVVRGGGRAVPLGETLGPLFRRRPKTMFSTDRVHPSALGYARAAALLLPSVAAGAEHYRRREALRAGGAEG
jgi:lysophospholipase L1-like esterase